MSEQAVGKSLNLTFDVSSGGVIALRMVDDDGRALDMAGVTPWGEVLDEHTGVKLADLGCSWGASGDILVDFPAMERGRYEFRVILRNDDGVDVVCVGGYVGYSAPKELREEGDIASVNRTLRVVINGERASALWSRTSAAEEAYKRVKAAQDSVSEDIEALEGAKEVVEKLHGEIADAVTIDAEGYWVIGGVRTRNPSRGERGDNGLDADTVKRVELASVGDLPEQGDGRHIYYVKDSSTGTYDVYLWGVGLTGDETWIGVSDPNNLKFATDTVAGLVQLSSTTTTSSLGGGIHRDSQGKIRVDDATETSKGAVRLSSNTGNVNDYAECIGNTDDRTQGGKQLGNGIGVLIATNDRRGVAKLASSVGTQTDAAPNCSAVNTFAHAAAQGEIGSYVEEAGDEGNALTVLINSLIADKISQVAAIPAGVEADFAGENAPDGWLVCDGRAVSRADYAALFTVIGTRYGAGDGSTTFNVPDRRDLVTIMPTTLGQTGGRVLGSVQEAYAPNITGRFICDDWFAGKAKAYWENSSTYKPIMDDEAQHEGCFKGVLYRGSGYVPTTYRQSLISGPDGERFKVMDTNGKFFLFNGATEAVATSEPTSNYSSSSGCRMTLSAARCSSVYRDGVTTLMPKNAAVLKIIKA